MQDSEKKKRSEGVLQNCPKENPEEVSEERNITDKAEASQVLRNKKAVDEAKPSQGYTKAQLIASERFSGKRDALSALLSEEEEYSVFDAEKVIEKFMKGKVN